MASIASHGPPSRFGLTLSFDPDEPVPVERMLAILGLVNLSLAPNKVLWPIKIPVSCDIDPGIDELQDLRMDWRDPFEEGHWYQLMVPEVMFGQVYDHCCLAFPDNHIAFKGPGRVAAVDVTILPMDTAGSLRNRSWWNCGLLFATSPAWWS